MKAVSSFLLIFVLAAGPLAPAAEQAAFPLTIDNIMRGPALYGYEPRAVRWSGDGGKIYFEWKQASDPREKEWDTWEVNRDGTGLRKLSEQEAKEAPPLGASSESFQFREMAFRSSRPVVLDRSRDKRWSIYVESGDLVLYENATGKRVQLTKTSDSETSPRFTRDSQHISFMRSGNLYLMSLESGAVEQLTDIRTSATPAAGAPPASTSSGFSRFLGRSMGREQQTETSGEQQKGPESQEYLKQQEKELLEVVKRRAAKREADEARRKKESPRKPFTLQSRQTLAGLQLSPDGKSVVALVGESTETPKTTIVPNYVTESSYTEDVPSRAKAGESQGGTRLAVLTTDAGDVKWVDFGLKPLPEPAAGPTPQTRSGDLQVGASGGRDARAPKEREVSPSAPVWSEDGAKAVLLVRSSDYKDRWIMALDPAAAKTRILFTEHDEAWIGMIGGSTLGWMKDDRSVYFLSERDGYSHLYTVSWDGGEPRQLTSGQWEVQRAQLSEDKTRFYLTTNEGSPFEKHLYLMAAEGGPRARITSAAGSHQTVLSPDEKWLADVHSFSNRPPELYIQENRPGAEAAKVTASPAPDFAGYRWIAPPIVEIPARDGVKVPARLYKPAGYKAGGPAVIFVHGAGYAQNVHRWWSTYPHEYLFHHFLMERGYLALDVDYRGSAGYGRNWRTAIYRHMGGKDLEDEVDAARWLVKEHGVDPQRIGIYGGSYGGFMTLMAMFTQPGVFAAGAALRPVTDWAHYNHSYSTSILNLPQKDTEAHRRSSPIYHAQGLKGALLICHGVVDTNVHFQDTVRLVQRLIELGKENWEVALYPVEDHSFQEPASWSDEYKRIFKLFETNLKKPAEAEKSGKAKRRQG